MSFPGSRRSDFIGSPVLRESFLKAPDGFFSKAYKPTQECLLGMSEMREERDQRMTVVVCYPSKGIYEGWPIPVRDIAGTFG